MKNLLFFIVILFPIAPSLAERVAERTITRELLVNLLSELERPLTKTLTCPGEANDNTMVLSNGDTEELSLVSLEYAQEIFDFLRCQEDIPFEYPLDGCYARAHRMAQLMEERGILSA